MKYVNHEQSEEQSEAGIDRSAAERGEPFAGVANRHSDCKAQGSGVHHRAGKEQFRAAPRFVQAERAA